MIHTRLKIDPIIKDMLPKFEQLVQKGELTAGQAGEQILNAFINDRK